MPSSPVTKKDIEDLLTKVDNLHYVFTDAEVERIHNALKFTETFHNDPVILQRMQTTFVKIEGFVYVSKWVAAFIVGAAVFAVNWDRLMVWIGWR